MTALEQARDAAANDDAELALEWLLTAWRAKRNMRIADLIDRVSAVASAGLASLVMRPEHKQRNQWYEVAKQRREIDFDRLAAVPMPRRHDLAMDQLRELFQWPPDPRLARMLARIVREVTFDPRRSEPFRSTVGLTYGQIMERLVELGDRRALTALEDLTPRELRYGRWRAERPAYARQLRAVPEPALDASEHALLTELEAMYPAERPDPAVVAIAATADELLAEVYERPDDVGARTVWGDLLVEQGDPRGEFIALQLSAHRDRAETRKREARLLALHGKQWIGLIGDWFDEEGRVFEGGVFAGGTLPLLRRTIPATVLADRAWRAVRTLELPRDDFDIATLDHPNLAGVRRLRLSANLLSDLAAKPRRLVELVVVNRLGEDLTSITRPQAFPDLRVLGLLGFGDLKWLFKAPVLERLEQLMLGLHPDAVSAWWKRLCDSPLPSVIVHLSVGGLAVERGWELRFERDRRGKLGALRCRLHYRPGMSADEIREVLLRFLEKLEPTGLLTEIEIEKSTSTLKIPKELVVAALGRFRSLGRTQLPW